MKTTKLILAATLLALAVPFVVSAKDKHEEGKEEKYEKTATKASIQPAGKVKPADLPALAKISFDDALKAARAAAPGSVIKAELAVEDGNLVYSFEIVGADKTVTEVEIDAGNGKVLDIDKD